MSAQEKGDRHGRMSLVVGGLRHFGRFGSAALGVTAILLIWCGAAFMIGTDRHRAEQAALQNGANLTDAFEQQIVRSIRVADQTLLYVRQFYAKDPGSFNIVTWAENSQGLTDLVFQIAIIGPDGFLVSSNLDPHLGRLDLSDRAHFRFHADSNEDTLYISAPVFGRVSERWSIQLTRRVTMPDGNFGGVIVASMDPAYLSRFYKSLHVDKEGTLTLVGTDGIIRAHAPESTSQVGKLLGSDYTARFAQFDSGAFVAASAADGVERLYSFSRISGYPLIVMLGQSTAQIYEIFRYNRASYIAASAMLTLLLSVMTAGVLRYQRRLAESRDAAEAGTRARSEFLAVMSHELRTPMNGVIGLAENLVGSEMDAEQKEIAITLRNSAHHLNHVLDDILDFSKMEADKLELEEISFDIREAINGALDILRSQAAAKNLQLSAEIAADVPATAIGDVARIRQVLLNLVGNAIKFTHCGGVTVWVGSDHVNENGEMQLNIMVADTGIGIPADGISLLFREFSQLDRSVSRRFGGTGLGLAICKRLVNRMGGTISVDSSVGLGSTFRFSIQLRVDEAGITDIVWERASIVPDANPLTQTGLRILLAEDNFTNQLVATKILERAGHSVTTASNGVETVAAVQRGRFDLVLMDVMMPEMDGISATHAIRNLPTPHRNCYIVALTANAFHEDVQACRDAGMNDFVHKPVTLGRLSAAINRYSEKQKELVS